MWFTVNQIKGVHIINISGQGISVTKRKEICEHISSKLQIVHLSYKITSNSGCALQNAF